MKSGIRRALAGFAACSALCAGAPLGAEPLTEMLGQSQAASEQAHASQAAIDVIADETRAALEEFRALARQRDGIAVHNARLTRQIENQAQRLAEIERSGAEVAVLQRDIVPLLVRMVDALAQFVALDKPFLIEQRSARVAALRAGIEQASVSPAQLFREVLDAYRAELEYGSRITAYADSVVIDGGSARVMNVLQVGRLALLAQTEDESVAATWDEGARAWKELADETYAASIRAGILMAREQGPAALLRLPLPAPEVQE